MGAWSAIRTVTKRELAAYFDSPVAYVFIVIFLLLTGFFTFTFGAFFDRGEASLGAFFMWLPWLFLFLVPAPALLFAPFLLLIFVFRPVRRGVARLIRPGTSR